MNKNTNKNMWQQLNYLKSKKIARNTNNHWSNKKIWIWHSWANTWLGGSKMAFESPNFISTN